MFEGAQRALRTAPAGGDSVTDVTITLRGMKAQPTDSSPHGFEIAGEQATRQALARAGIALVDAHDDAAANGES